MSWQLKLASWGGKMAPPGQRFIHAGLVAAESIMERPGRTAALDHDAGGVKRGFNPEVVRLAMCWCWPMKPDQVTRPSPSRAGLHR